MIVDAQRGRDAVNVIEPMIVAALANGNDAVFVTDAVTTVVRSASFAD
jgi:hypothetical protein